MKNFLSITLSLSILMMVLTSCTKPDQIQIWDLSSFSPGPAEEKIKNEPPAIIYPVLNANLAYDSISDVEGNIYKTIKIGNQTWMAENLKTTMYNDSTDIPIVPDLNMWRDLKTGAYRWYDNDIRYKKLYGALYNWYTVNTGILCPAGWHVPDDGDWRQLEMFLGMTGEEASRSNEIFDFEGRGTNQGTQMKATSGWYAFEGIGGTNTSGFSALPAGEFPENWFIDQYTAWWDSTYEGAMRAVNTYHGVIRCIYPAYCGLSVRCLKN